jgi:acetoin utilization protein AcuB
MTPFPYSIDAGSSLEAALSMMADHDIRHLPVREGGAIVGIVSDRDIRQALNPSLAPPTGSGLTVKHVMLADPYIVDLHAPLDNVLLNLAGRHIDCALVVKEGRLAGVFTTTDACRVFGEHLRSLRPPHGDDAA